MTLKDDDDHHHDGCTEILKQIAMSQAEYLQKENADQVYFVTEHIKDVLFLV